MSVGRHGLAAVSVGSSIYAVGGCSCAGAILSTMERLDPRMRSWAVLAPLPVARESLAMATINEDIYALGGRNARGAPVRMVDIFDVASFVHFFRFVSGY